MRRRQENVEQVSMNLVPLVRIETKKNDLWHRQTIGFDLL